MIRDRLYKTLVHFKTSPTIHLLITHQDIYKIYFGSSVIHLLEDVYEKSSDNFNASAR